MELWIYINNAIFLDANGDNSAILTKSSQIDMFVFHNISKVDTSCRYYIDQNQFKKLIQEILIEKLNAIYNPTMSIADKSAIISKSLSIIV